MSCTHSIKPSACASQCSQCAGAAARIMPCGAAEHAGDHPWDDPAVYDALAIVNAAKPARAPRASTNIISSSGAESEAPHAAVIAAAPDVILSDEPEQFPTKDDHDVR